jgi:hypothetical protein
MAHVVIQRERTPWTIERIPSAVFLASTYPEAGAGVAVWATLQDIVLAGDDLGGSSATHAAHCCRGSPQHVFREVSHETFHRAT